MDNLEILDNDFLPNEQGLIKFKCINCNNSFIEEFDKGIPAYKHCPHCGCILNEIERELNDIEYKIANNTTTKEQVFTKMKNIIQSLQRKGG
jgi:DNA-directed RNA polymerase subunit RPC12/RpoP